MAKKSTVTSKLNTIVSIGPYGKNEIEQSFRLDLEQVLSEVASKYEMEYKPFWELSNFDMPSGIFEALTSARLVIADLRGLNPNVMYELGIRHAFNLPTILLKDPHTELSWDIDKNFVLTYPLPIQISKKNALISTIEKQIQNVFEEEKKAKPIFSSFVINATITQSIKQLNLGDDVSELLENLLSRVERLANRPDQNMAEALDELTPRHLLAWSLVNDKKLSQSEAAEKMNLSQGRVSQLIGDYRRITGKE